MGEFFLVILITIGLVIFFGMLVVIFSRYKRCPSDRILVIYGKIGKGREGAARSAKCIHGGAAFVWPVIQNYQFLDLTPISIEVNLTKALSRQNIRVDVPSRFTVGISTESGVMTNAAERLLGLRLNEIQELAKDIIFGQLRLVIATMDIEEINTDRDKFLSNVTKNVEAELKKIGLKLINVNVTDIKDESGYIEALGKEAAAKAINDAKKSVAEKNRDGSIGEANALRDQRIQVSSADATAVEGENVAKISVANSEAERRSKEAEALRKATASENVQRAKSLEESYFAEQAAECARAEKERATRTADIVIAAEVDKKRVEIDAEADAERVRRRARGDADGTLSKMKAEALGVFEVLSKQAAGFEKLVEAAGNESRDAVLLMIADKLPELVKTQVEAIKNIKIDKVTVWDSAGGNAGGSSATANFLSGMLKSLPPLNDLFQMAGMELPDLLKGGSGDKDVSEEPAQEEIVPEPVLEIEMADEDKPNAD